MRGRRALHVSRASIVHERGTRRVPAHDLEQIVIGRVREHLADLSRHLDGPQGAGLDHSIQAADGAIDQLSSGSPQRVRAAALALIKRVEVGKERIAIELHGGETGDTTVLEAAAAKIRSGREVKLVIPGSEEEADARRDGKLVVLLAKALESARALSLHVGLKSPR